MCLAIFKPKGKTISREHLFNGFSKNADGAGIAYNTNDGLVVQKGFFDFEKFYDAYRAQETRKMLIHFRWKTHGDKNEFNCHPWKLEVDDYQCALIHNGVLSIKSTDKMSDTGHFAHAWLFPLLKKHSVAIWREHAFRLIIEDFIGRGNKIAIMDNKGNHAIWNEDEGFWDNGVWYSNRDYLTGKTYYGHYEEVDDYWNWRGGSVNGCGPQGCAPKGANGLQFDRIKINQSDDKEGDTSITMAEIMQEQAEREAEESQQEIQMMEDYLESLQEQDQVAYEVAIQVIARAEAKGRSRIQALSEALC